MCRTHGYDTLTYTFFLTSANIYQLRGRNISEDRYHCIVTFDLLLWLTRITVCHCPAVAYGRNPLLSIKSV